MKKKIENGKIVFEEINYYWKYIYKLNFDKLDPKKNSLSFFNKTYLSQNVIWFLICEKYFPKRIIFGNFLEMSEKILQKVFFLCFLKNLKKFNNFCTKFFDFEKNDKNDKKLNFFENKEKLSDLIFKNNDKLLKVKKIVNFGKNLKFKKKCKFFFPEIFYLKFFNVFFKRILKLLKKDEKSKILKNKKNYIKILKKIKIENFQKILKIESKKNKNKILKIFQKIKKKKNLLKKSEKFFCRKNEEKISKSKKNGVLINSIKNTDLLYNLKTSFPIEKKYFKILRQKKISEKLKKIENFLKIEKIQKTKFSPSEIFCFICNDPDYSENNNIVFCAKCNISVHQICYDLKKLPGGDWICDVCLSFGANGRFLDCFLCDCKGGVLKECQIKYFKGGTKGIEDEKKIEKNYNFDFKGGTKGNFENLKKNENLNLKNILEEKNVDVILNEVIFVNFDKKVEKEKKRDENSEIEILENLEKKVKKKKNEIIDLEKKEIINLDFEENEKNKKNEILINLEENNKNEIILLDDKNSEEENEILEKKKIILEKNIISENFEKKNILEEKKNSENFDLKKNDSLEKNKSFEFIDKKMKNFEFLNNNTKIIFENKILKLKKKK